MPELTFLPKRRRVLGMLGAIGAGCLATRALHSDFAAAAPASAGSRASCALTPALAEGPFFVDERFNRSDLTAGATRAGVVDGLPLRLVIDLSSVRGTECRPVAGVQVDVWHASATGEYSDESMGMGQGSTEGQTWLRGYQISDADGKVAFKTIYPGSYAGRTVHIHVKTRMFNAAGNATYEFTTQLFFDDAANDIVMQRPAYSARGGGRTRNAQDFLYGSNGRGNRVDLAPMPGTDPGYIATAALALTLPTGS
jgi:protocatechuate 3,4-dioxygenase beta subunit